MKGKKNHPFNSTLFMATVLERNRIYVANNSNKWASKIFYITTSDLRRPVSGMSFLDFTFSTWDMKPSHAIDAGQPLG
jgi:hypothetical protein